MQYLETAQGAKSRVPSCEATSTLVNICILYTTLHHFLSISLDEQRIRMSHMLLLCKIIVCTKNAQNSLHKIESWFTVSMWYKLECKHDILLV